MTYVRLPLNDPCSGRYAVLSPIGSYAQWPNPEDHIVIAKNSTGEFTPVFATYVPWDEAPLQLWEDLENADRLVVYHGYYLTYSPDGGRSFRELGERATEILAFDRWWPSKLMAARFGEDCLIVEVGEWHIDWQKGSTRIDKLTVWEVGLGPDAEPVRTKRPPTEGARGWTRSDGTAVGKPARGAPLKIDQGDLMSWDAEAELFRKVPLFRLIEDIARAGPSNFFGADGARSVMR